MRKKEQKKFSWYCKSTPSYIHWIYVRICISIHKSSVGKFLTNAWLFMLVDACLCLCCDTRMYACTNFNSFFFLLSLFLLCILILVSLYWVQWGPFACETIFFHSLKRILWFFFFVSYCWVFFVGWEIRMRIVKGEALRWLRKWIELFVLMNYIH